MAPGFDHAPLLAQTYPLPRGPRVRLRLATPRDASAIQALVERCAAAPTPHVDVAALVSFDPRDRVVICATALTASGETVLGVGVVDLDGADRPMLFVDRELTDGLDELLSRALQGRVNAVRRAQAA
jgi:hypothetical protein